MQKKLFPPLATSLFPGLLALLCLAVALGGPGMQELLRYQRDAIVGGEVWRLVTAHLTHLGWSHLWLNLAGLVLIWLLVGRAFGAAGWLVVFLISALGASAGLWFLQPELHWYVGLSGVLHGLLVAGALASWGSYKDAPILLGLVAAKLAWEQWMGPMPGSAAAAGGPVVVAAHLYGAVSGAVGFGMLRLVRRGRRM
jgi:rhomboid family GlyGly-CTERM serine protease